MFEHHGIGGRGGYAERELTEEGEPTEIDSAVNADNADSEEQKREGNRSV